MTAKPAVRQIYRLRTTGRSQTEPDAFCLTCGWRRRDIGLDNWLAVRAAARRHCRSAGHTVRVSVRDVYIYDLVSSQP